MSDMAVEQGLYLKTLTKRESIAHMATTVMEYLMVKGRYQEAIAVGYAILDNYPRDGRSEEHTSELQSLMRISYAVFCLKKKTIEKVMKETSNTMRNTTSTSSASDDRKT